MDLKRVTSPDVTSPVLSQHALAPRVPAAASHSSPTSTSTPAPAATPTPEEVREVVRELEKNLKDSHTDLRFSVDNTTGKTIVSVVDSETKEVIRQIPAEEIMQMARFVERMKGVLFNGKA